MPIDTTTAPGARAARRSDAWPLFIVALACVLVFARALGGGLVYDDTLLVARNPALGSLSSIPSFFSRPYWAFLEPETRVGFWRPLTATALALGHALGGGAPWGFHAVSLAVHVLASCAATLLVRRLTGSRRVAVFSGLLFALHPLQVEGVAWISALNDPLSVAASLFATWCWLGWRRAGSRGLPVGAAAWFALALLAKESSLVVLPLVLLVDLLAWRPAASASATETSGRSTAGYGLLAVVLVAWLGARVLVFDSVWAGFDLVSTRLGVGTGRLALLRLELFGGALRLLAWPFDLTLFRPFRPHLAASDPVLLTDGALSLLWVLLLGLAWKRGSRRLLFALALVPVSLTIVLARVESLWIFPLSDRFVSLAALGFGMALTLALSRAQRLGGLVLGALIVVYGAASFQRIGAWHDEETLFRDALAKAPRSPYVHWGLGRVLLDRYLATQDPELLNEAEQVFLAAQDLLVASREHDTDVLAGPTDFLQINLGYGWVRLLQDERSGYQGSSVALGIFQELAERIEAVEEERLDARALGNWVEDVYLELEQVYTAIGVAEMRAGRLEEAERAFAKAIERNPSYPEAHQNLGRLYARQKEWVLAARHFERAAELRPGELEDRLLMAQAYAALGRNEPARELALALRDELPGPEPLLVLAEVAIAQRQAAEALEEASQAVARAPQSARAHYLRAQALLLSDAPQEALTELRRAVELDPRDFSSAYDLGVLLARQDRVDEAVPELVRAYGLCQDEELRGRLRQALVDLPHASPEPLLQLAVTDARRQENEATLGWLDLLLASFPGHAEAALQKGRILRRLGRHEEALQLMREACAGLERPFPALTELGVYLAERGLVDEAIERLEQAAALGAPRQWPSEIRAEAQAELDRRLQALRERAASAGG